MNLARTVRVVGRVFGRSSWLAIVSDAEGPDVRVSWSYGTPKMRDGWHCDVHGHMPSAQPCEHAITARIAAADQRSTESKSTTERKPA